MKYFAPGPVDVEDRLQGELEDRLLDEVDGSPREEEKLAYVHKKSVSTAEAAS